MSPTHTYYIHTWQHHVTVTGVLHIWVEHIWHSFVHLLNFFYFSLAFFVFGSGSLRTRTHPSMPCVAGHQSTTRVKKKQPIPIHPHIDNVTKFCYHFHIQYFNALDHNWKLYLKKWIMNITMSYNHLSLHHHLPRLFALCFLSEFLNHSYILFVQMIKHVNLCLL